MSAHQMLMAREQLTSVDFTLVATASASNLTYPVCSGPTIGYSTASTGDSITPTAFRGITINRMASTLVYFADDLELICTFDDLSSFTEFQLASAPSAGQNFFKRIEFWNSTYTTKTATLNASDASYSAGLWTWSASYPIGSAGTYYLRIVFSPTT